MVEKEEQYRPIDCNFYDRIEGYILLGKEVKLSYQYAGEVITVFTKLTNTLTKESIEYLLLPNEKTLRMDTIIAINDLPLK